MKRIITLLSVLLIMATLAVSCVDKPPDDILDDVGNDDEDTLSNYDKDGYIKDNLPDDLRFPGEKLMMLYWADYTMNEFFAEGNMGNVVDDAIYDRNRAVEERLGVTLEYFGQKGYESHSSAYMQRVENDINSGLLEYKIFASYSKTIAAMSLRGLLADLAEVNHLDFDMPWWPKSLVDECTINDRLYFCSGDISTNMLWMMIGTFFNSDMIDTYGLESPYDLVAANKWTIDKLIEMTGDIYTDNGDNIQNLGDTFGFIIYDENIDAFFTSAGLRAIEKDGAGELTISPSYHGEKIVNLLEKIGGYIANSPGVMRSSSIYIRDNFFNENVLMTMDRVFIVAGKDNREYNTRIDFKYGIVPNAKNSETDPFYTNLGHPFTIYAISASLVDTDVAGAVLECLASESYRKVTPAVFEESMKFRYTHDGTAAKMYDIIRSTVVFDLGRLYSVNFGGFASDLFRQTVISNGSNFMSKYKAIERTLNTGIAKINEAYS